MTENHGTSNFAMNYDVNAFFHWFFHCRENCICSVGCFKDRPTVNLLDCQHLIDTKHLCNPLFRLCVQSENHNQKFECCSSGRGCKAVCALYFFLLPCLQTIRGSDRDSRTVIGRTRHVPLRVRIVTLSFPELEMDKTVQLEFYLPLFGRSKHQFQ